MYFTAITTHLKTKRVLLCLRWQLTLLLSAFNLVAFAQAPTTATWTGAINSKWEEAGNWEPKVVPTSNTHVIINGAGGQKQPESIQTNKNEKNRAECLSLTIGGGTNQAKLRVENLNGLHIETNLTILDKGTLENTTTPIFIKGNWQNNGTYNEDPKVQNNNWLYVNKVEFIGANQTISGSSPTQFLELHVKGRLTLESNIKIDLTGYNYGNLIVYPGAVIDPGNYKISWSSTKSAVAFQLQNGATILVKAQNYLDNYSIRPTIAYGGTSIEHTSTINYAGTIDQNIDDQIIYQKLVISGTGVKSLVGNTSISSGAADTEVNVMSATLDLKTYTLTRQAAGGSFIVADGATVKIGGPTNTPLNFNTRTFAPASTVEYYGGVQEVQHNTYGHLTFSNTGIKTMPASAMTIAGNLTSTGTTQYTAGGALTIGGNVTIGSGSIFTSGNFTHTIAGNWLNNGTFNPGTGTISFVGSNNTTITGSAVFNGLTINKTTTTNAVTLANNATATTLNMMSGELRTGINKVTILGDRTGDGWVLGTVTRQHTFVPGTAYAFNSRFSTLAFTGGTGVTEATMTTGTATMPTGFLSGKSINRLYEITVAPGTYANASLQLQYQDTELNGCEEDGLKLYYSLTGTGNWSNASRHAYSAAENWVKRNSVTSLNGFWTLTDNPSTYKWEGTQSIAWEDGRNWEVWTDGSPTRGITGPISSDFVILGENTPVQQRQPTITANEWVRDISFKEPNPITLTIAAGSLRTNHNLATVGAGTAIQHNLIANAQTINIGGNLILNDGSAGNNLSFTGTNVTINLTGNLEHHQASSIILGAGNLNIGGNYNYTGGTFTAGTSTVTYNGTGAQVVAGLPYHHVTVNKTAGTATLSSTATQSITGNLTVTNSTMALFVPTLNVAGNVSLTGGTLQGNSSTIDMKGDWLRTGGTYIPGSSAVNFSGANPQTVAGTTFHNLSKTAANTLTTTGISTLTGNLSVQSGTLILNGHTMNRTSAGGTLTVADGATLQINTLNYPTNYSTNTLGVNSTVIYSGGTIGVGVAGVTYGNLVLQSGTVRPLLNNTRVANQMSILGSATTLSNPAAVYTLTLDKDLTSDGIINASNTNLLFTSPTAKLSGTGAGTTIIKDVTVNTGANLTVSKDLTLYGNLLNNGSGFSAAGNRVDFRGTTAATITSAVPVTINELLINKTSATTLVELFGSVDGLQTVNVNTGTLDARDKILTKKAAAPGTSLTVGDLATLKIGHTNSLPLLDNYSLQPTSTVIYNGSHQTIKSVQYGHLELQNTGTATFEAGIAKVAGNMTKGAEANVITPQTIEFNGNSPQQMPGINYKNLSIAAAGTKTLTGNALIEESLSFGTSLIGTTLVTGLNEVELGANANLVGEANERRILGTIKTTRLVEASANNFGGMGITIAPAVDAGMSTMTRVTGLAAVQEGKSIGRLFHFEPSTGKGKFNAAVTVSYFDAELSANTPEYEEQLQLVGSIGPGFGWYSWSSPGQLDMSTNTISVSGINSINYMTINNQITPLPVELLYFKATKQDNVAVLEWKTASEKNNRGFEVEASADGYSYQKIGFVQSVAGTSAMAQNYTFTDNRNGKDGIVYYRLRQVDEDGTFKFYGPRTVNFGAVTKTAIVAYPNPFESEVKLAVEATSEGKAKLTLYTTTGKILTQHEEQLARGASVLQLNLNQNLPRGLYLLTIEQNGEVETLKLIKN
ncbi:T9SS type A sorting domain-containing protein [Pontibacter sp. BT310]|uniref:T9SS type A sorting domain-containing protein n=1 Tax=Pontibacter populi TaxID=890055 RepID=A0ABS6XB87_9BACT|nr:MULTISPECIES: T9SS type A sorting domain-containing protein [Pontibacter]MBJ6117518.1 T9SS type A sorting domain-containing protein [Pontibacter sp. BT310]MBR0569943.1 T9SS type A sorting domain-containing protein [Microvirga sp. STS03]MBW3364371.1 T9SS type A sorting domain-containing protein [Pontibacter populi]